MKNFENLPAELRERGHWCLWRYEHTPDGRLTKVPYNAKAPQYHARANDVRTFSDYKTASAVYEASQASAAKFSGLGVAVLDDLCAIDIDNCLADGVMSAMAADVVDTMDCYSECSPSGNGLRLLFKVAPSFAYDATRFFIHRPHGLEVYASGATRKFVTVTGNVIRGGDLVERSTQLTAVLEKYMVRPSLPPAETQRTSCGLDDVPDAMLIARAMHARNGGKFETLWSGGNGGYSSASEGDMALCSMLAYWTGGDVERMDRLFRQSGRMRPKWTRKQAGSTYGQLTLQKAAALCTETWQGGEHNG